MTGSSLLTLSGMTGFPTLKVTAKADAQADRALAEAGRHTTDNAAGRAGIKPRPSNADVTDLARRAAKHNPRRGALILPGAVAQAVEMAACHPC